MQLSNWLEQQRRKSKTVNDKVDLALAFMQNHYGNNDRKILSEMRCIDFSKQVEGVGLDRGTILVGYKDPRVSPYRSSYFTRSGHPASRLGIATESRPSYKDRKTGKKYSADTTLEKVIRRYEVMVPITKKDALMSYCAPAADNWSTGKKVLAAGGGLQYLIPQANRFLRSIED